MCKKGYKQTEEHKRKQCLARTGQKRTKESKERMRMSQLGKRQSPETIEKRIASRRGIPRSEETKRKISLGNLGKKKSEEHCRNMSISQKKRFEIEDTWNEGLTSKDDKRVLGRENHPGWKGGITPLNKQIRHSDKYNEWRLEVFIRDNFICQECGLVRKNINAHHIKPPHSILEDNNIFTFESALNCSELWNINNGITLCEDCHSKINTRE